MMDRPQWFHGDFVGPNFTVVNRTTQPLHVGVIDYEKLSSGDWMAVAREDITLPFYIEAIARGEALDDGGSLVLLSGYSKIKWQTLQSQKELCGVDKR